MTPGWRSTSGGGLLADGAVASLPSWLRPVADLVDGVQPGELSQFLPPPQHGGREGAVLLLFGQDADGSPDVLLIERAHDMRSHPGQPAFPGGAVDPGDDGPLGAALREAQEETGLDPAGVTLFGMLPALWLPPSNFVVSPVLGWWHAPSPVSAVDPREVASVVRVPVEELTDPARRVRVRHPSGYVGPGFEVGGLLVWGFTGGLLSTLLRLVGWERPWEPAREVDLPDLGTAFG